MALAINNACALGVSRQVFQVVGGDALTGWHLMALGHEGAVTTVVQPRDNAGINEVLNAANPAPFSPFGDVVLFTPAWPAFFFASPTLSPLTAATSSQWLTQSWIEFVALPGVPYAIVISTAAPERFVFALSSELSLVSRNPFF